MGAMYNDREFDVVLFDLDDALYDVPEMSQTVRANIIAYLRDALGVPADEVEATTMRLYREHGTTIAGVVAEGLAQVDFEHFHSCVHATLDYERLLRPNGVREMLANLTAQKHLFTNADANHAAECLKCLDLEGCFESIFCFETMQQLNDRPSTVLCKPSRRAYEAVLARLGVAEASRVVFVDDSPKNVAAAHALGIFTVLIGRDHVPGADLVIADVRELPRVLPSLFAPATPPTAEPAEAAAVPIVVPA